MPPVLVNRSFSNTRLPRCGCRCMAELASGPSTRPFSAHSAPTHTWDNWNSAPRGAGAAHANPSVQQQQRTAAYPPVAGGPSGAAVRPPHMAQPVPLSLVVKEATKRWFEDTLTEAERGDVKQQALLGQMYAEGYGCVRDLQAAKAWTDRAAHRGMRMRGVYCEL